jgi:hypothetical protein
LKKDNKIRNFIYYDICEISYIMYKENSPLSISYRGFCKSIQASILLNNINNTNFKGFRKIHDTLYLIYGFSYAESLEFIYEFFTQERWSIYEEAVLLIREYFKNLPV